MRVFIPVLISLFLAASPSQSAPSIGKLAPSFSATDSYGKVRSLKEFAGKIVILEWTNDGCPYVRKHYGSGNMQGVQKDLTAQGAVWLSIISMPF